jgi:hypothetical protein
MAAILKAMKAKGDDVRQGCDAPNVISGRVRGEKRNERGGVRWRSLGSRTRRG